MPARLVVRLDSMRPTAVPPRHTGPAVHAAVLDAIRASNPALATQLHDTPKFKPFALTPLLAGWDRDTIEPAHRGGPARIELALLADELTAPALDALADRDELLVGTTRYRVESVDLDAAVPYPALAATARPRARWRFHLVTPVTVATTSDDGIRRDLPWPDPVRMFTGLARRWATFAEPWPAEITDTITRHAQTSDGRVRVVDHLAKAPALYRRGAIGTVEFGLAEPRTIPSGVTRAIDALAAFAEYAGMGDRTTVGMGHVRLTR